MVQDMKLMYRFFQEQGLRASQKDFQEEAKILGAPPRRFDDFAGEAVEAWMKEPVSTPR